MSHSITSLYSYDDRGWRTYNIDNMSQQEVQVVADTCPNEAVFTRIKTALLVGGVVLGLTGTAFAGYAVGKLAAVSFGYFAAQFGVAFEVAVPTAAVISSKLIGSGLALYGTSVALIKVWENGKAKVEDLWGYAAHLDQQAKDALLRKGYLEHLAQVS